MASAFAGTNFGAEHLAVDGHALVLDPPAGNERGINAPNGTKYCLKSVELTLARNPRLLYLSTESTIAVPPDVVGCVSLVRISTNTGCVVGAPPVFARKVIPSHALTSYASPTSEVVSGMFG